MKSALLVGGSGFIGRGLSTELRARGVEVQVVNRSVRDVRAPLDEPIPEVDVVFHLAQSPLYRDFPASSRDLFLTNLFSLNEYCRAAIDRARLVVFFSSGSVFGRPTELVTPETPPTPGDFYSFTKLAGEQCLAQYASSYATLVLRPFQPYGPGQVDKLLPNLAGRILAGDTLRLTAGMRMSFLHLRDVANLTIAAAERLLADGGQRVFNLASSEVVSLDEAARMLGEALGRTTQAELNEDGTESVIAADCRDLYEYCGRDPELSLRAGLADLAASMK